VARMGLAHNQVTDKVTLCHGSLDDVECEDLGGHSAFQTTRALPPRHQEETGSTWSWPMGRLG
jgi:hypothetical protein